MPGVSTTSPIGTKQKAIYKKGPKAPSTSLLMSPNWVVRWTCQKGHPSYRDLDRLEEWASKICMKFNKDKCKILHRGQHKQRAQYRLGSVWLGSTLLKGTWGSWWTTS
ncbi:hypothetical protein QYF61_000805 [Mycteria americana]|uniref:Uncharacterized protein n=1 Tax=Mycteria americana TaxID=33587 RepID=A0AAN7NMN7_MYCAM|nr:hypothetical protein QYF61_000805 [Mycteria americana]